MPYPNALNPNPSLNALANVRMLQRPEESYMRQQFPGTYGFLGGLMGTAPAEMQGSVLDPNTAAVRQGASYGYLPGLVGSSVPLGKAGAGLGMLAGMARGVGKADEALAAVQSAKRFNNSALTGNVFPQEEALRLAQQRATLPVEQYGLGLPAGNTPEQRAAAMGFDVNNPLYHATDVDFSSIIPSVRGKIGAGVYTSPSAKYTEKYAGENARIMPLVGRGKFADEDIRINIADQIRQELANKNPNFSVQEWKTKNNQTLKDLGYAGADMDKERLIFNPENLRSRFAAFDPFRKTAAIAAAAGLAAPDLLAGQVQPQTRQFDNSALK